MKKSKFLKKSLAMLLALMLVVAMIPLSASASSINLDSIYVDGNKVKIDGDSLSVGVYTTAETVEVGTNEDLKGWDGNEHELRVADPDSLDEMAIDQWDSVNDAGTEIDLDTYMYDVDAAGNGKITLKLYDLTTGDRNGRLEKTITMNVTRTTADTTTNLASVKPGVGVYKILNDLDEINETKVIKVQVARNHKFTGAGEEQDELQATINVTTAKGATLVAGKTEVNANDGDTFEVKSASKTNVSQFTVEAEYLDALESFTVTGYDGKEYTATPVDTDKDDIPDTINVVLPYSAITETTWGDVIDEPTLEISYAVNGNLKDTLKIGNDYYETGDKLFLEDLNTTATGYKATVIVNRLQAYSYESNGDVKQPADNDKSVAQQEYTLKVTMEKSSSTAIQSIMVNNTVVDEDALSADPISVELPTTWYNEDGTPTDQPEDTHLTSVKVAITTDATVSGVTLAGETQTGDDGVLNDAKTTRTWTFTGVNLSKEQTISVFAQDGTTMAQTGIVASYADSVSSAVLTAFSLKDKSGNTYGGNIVGNTITVEVPYMTTDLTDWTMFATPSAQAKAVAAYSFDTEPGANGSTYYVLKNPVDVINGTTGVADLGYIDVAAATDTKAVAFEGRIQAVSMTDNTVNSTYTVQIILKKAQTGDQLEGIDFTVQTDKHTSDKQVWRAKSKTNTFHANVAQATDTTRTVGEVNMKIPPSLTNKDPGNDLGITYRNIVTGIQAQEGAVVYAITERWDNNGSTAGYSDETGIKLVPLKATTNDDSTTLTGSLITDYSQYHTGAYQIPGNGGDSYVEIVVLPEQYARQLELGKLAGGTNGKMMITVGELAKYGNLYEVVIEADKAETEAELKTIKVGDYELTINSDMTITGTLPWSYTVDDEKDVEGGMFAEFTMSDYAVLTGSADGKSYEATFFSNGDWTGDGIEDEIGEPNPSEAAVGDWNNRKFLFVRNTDRTVNVYFATDKKSADLVGDKVKVEAENRLTPTTAGTYSSTTYTFKLKWAPASDETSISNFKLGNYSGVVNGHNISVDVPYGTDVTGLIATFDQSIGSVIRVNDRVGGVILESGVTSVNYTNPVKLYVTSESGNNTVEYTVTVNQGFHFSDIDENDWYYDNVMDAANNGYVTGYPDGTFQPKKATTRAEFASMIANAMGYEADPDVASMFPDVADDFWGKAAINFCAQNGIITGYDDGTFQPNKAITRQEAASILRNAFKLTESSSETFPDDSAISGWAKESVYIVKASGLMKGDAGTGNFRPTDTIIRAEAASILMNAKYAGLIK